MPVRERLAVGVLGGVEAVEFLRRLCGAEGDLCIRLLAASSLGASPFVGVERGDEATSSFSAEATLRLDEVLLRDGDCCTMTAT